MENFFNLVMIVLTVLYGSILVRGYRINGFDIDGFLYLIPFIFMITVWIIA